MIGMAGCAGGQIVEGPHKMFISQGAKGQYLTVAKDGTYVWAGPLIITGRSEAKFCFEAKQQLICAILPQLPIPEALRRKP